MPENDYKLTPTQRSASRFSSSSLVALLSRSHPSADVNGVSPSRSVSFQSLSVLLSVACPMGHSRNFSRQLDSFHARRMFSQQVPPIPRVGLARSRWSVTTSAPLPTSAVDVSGPHPSSGRAARLVRARIKLLSACKFTTYGYTPLDLTINLYHRSSILTMAPTLMAGTIATGQSYMQPGSLSNPAQTDPSKSSAALWEGKIQLHPDTDKNDPAYKRFSGGQNQA